MTLGAKTKGFHLLQVSCLPSRVRQVSRILSRKDCMKNFSHHEEAIKLLDEPTSGRTLERCFHHDFRVSIRTLSSFLPSVRAFTFLLERDREREREREREERALKAELQEKKKQIESHFPNDRHGSLMPATHCNEKCRTNAPSHQIDQAH
jgi:hypothetical protein